MSNEANEKDGSESKPAARKKNVPLLLAVVGAVVLGAGGGAFVAGPMLMGKKGTPAAAGAEGHAGKGGAKDGEHGAEGGEAGVPKPVYQIDNLVLNPAGTEGTRFLMVTVAVGAKDEETMAVMKERDLELRDAALRVLGTKTVQELADVSRRDSIKSELLKVLSGQLPPKSVREVFLPQFVIQ